MSVPGGLGRAESRAEARLQRLLGRQATLARVTREIGSAYEVVGVSEAALSGLRALVDLRSGRVELSEDGGGVRVTARHPSGPGRQSDGPCVRRFPLVALSGEIGALCIEPDGPGAFDEDDVAIVEILAAHVSEAIANARQRAELLELERMKADFTARISHELRTPLTVMTGFVDTLLISGEHLDAPQREAALNRIQAAAMRLSTLLEEILTVSSMDAGMTRMKPKRVELGSLMREVRDLSLDASRVVVRCGDDITLFTDPVILRHIVNQLVDNALKYGGDAEVAGGRDESGQLHISVRDHGPGVAPGDRRRIFVRFYRGTHSGAGMGLGLPVVAQLAGSLGATVALDDPPGGGARFTLRFG